MKKQVLITFFICSLLVATETLAQEAASGKGDFFGVSLGGKGAFGGNYLNTPTDVPPSSATLPYEDGAGGIGGGGGFYTEFRILWGHLGIEFDVLFDRSKNWSSIEYNNVVNTDWIYRFTSVRLPILLEGSVENQQARGSIGIGPEFVIGMNADAEIEVTEGEDYVNPSDLAAWNRNFTAKTQTDTFLCFNVGAAFKVWKLIITADIRYSLNLTQPEDYFDRVEFTGTGDDTQTETIASNTMDLRLMLGLAYDLGF